MVTKTWPLEINHKSTNFSSTELHLHINNNNNNKHRNNNNSFLYLSSVVQVEDVSDFFQQVSSQFAGDNSTATHHD